MYRPGLNRRKQKEEAVQAQYSDTAPDELEFNQCQEAVRRLHDYLSHELPRGEQAKVEEHLAQCDGCFAKFHFEEALLRMIRERAAQVHAPDALRAKVMSLLHTHPSGDEGHSATAPPAS